MTKTNQRAESAGSGVTSEAARDKSKASASKKASNTGVRTTSSGNRRGGSTSNERMSAKRPRIGSESNAGSDGQKQEATPPTLKESLRERGEDPGTKHARGRHGATPKQSGSGGSAQYIRRSV